LHTNHPKSRNCSGGQVRNPQSSILNPQSKIRNQKSASCLTANESSKIKKVFRRAGPQSKIHNQKSAIKNPQSKIRNQKSVIPLPPGIHRPFSPIHGTLCRFCRFVF